MVPFLAYPLSAKIMYFVVFKSALHYYTARNVRCWLFIFIQ